MKLAMVISTNEAEAVFNALRLGNYAAQEGDDVGVFLLGKGVELDRIEDDRFDVRAQAATLLRGCVRSQQSPGGSLKAEGLGDGWTLTADRSLFAGQTIPKLRLRLPPVFTHALSNGGRILACGTCLKLRESGGSDLCPLSTMKDLYELIRDADHVVSV